MADFVQKTVVKSAVRKLATPIENVAAFNTIVQSVITDNLFACTAYESAGVNHAPVEKTKENYVVTFSRDTVSITSYSDDAIRTKVETWADTVAALA